MPRKAIIDPVAAAEPRRSARISSQPKAPPVEKPKASRKRTVDDVMNEETETTEEKPEAEADLKADDQPSTQVEPQTENGESANKKSKADEEIDELEDDDDDSESEVPVLKIGDSLPSITLKNEKEEDVNVKEIASVTGVVIFLIPKADTPGCTQQACGFRDIYSDFEAVGYKVYCLSADTSAAQSKWQSKKELPYSLLSDPQRKFIGALGAAENNKTKRSHFVFEKGGKLLDKKMPVKPVDSPKLALQFIKGLQA